MAIRVRVNHLIRYVNCQNSRFLGSQNAHMIVEKQMRQCLVRLLVKDFVENETGQVVNLCRVFLSKLDDIDVNMWF